MNKDKNKTSDNDLIQAIYDAETFVHQGRVLGCDTAYLLRKAAERLSELTQPQPIETAPVDILISIKAEGLGSEYAVKRPEGDWFIPCLRKHISAEQMSHITQWLPSPWPTATLEG